jgi:hypothetical protein
MAEVENQKIAEEKDPKLTSPSEDIARHNGRAFYFKMDPTWGEHSTITAICVHKAVVFNVHCMAKNFNYSLNKI